MKVGDGAQFAVPSRPRWVDTGITLVPGHTYELRAVGTWRDWNIATGPLGYESPGWLHRATERFRRVPTAPWFALIGALSRDLKSAFVIGDHCVYAPEQAGALSCFANDLSLAHFNNHGAIHLSVQRIA